MFSQTPYAKHFMNKVAFVPYTPEAMGASQGGAPMPPDAAAAQGGAMPPGGAPMPPDAAAAGAAGGAPAPQQGGAPQIQIVQGPNGEPMDAQTGFIVLDPQQGIEQDPLTGILINMSTGEFATPEGQPLDPNQAMQMIQQARQQAEQAGGEMPPEGGAPAEGMPPEAAGAAPEGAPQEAPPPEEPAPAPAPETGAAPEGGEPTVPPPTNQSFDPSTGMMIDDATGMPVDPNTGMLVDPATGQQVDPQSGMPAPAASQDMPFTDDPEILKVVDQVSKETEKMAKSVSGLTRNVNSFRTDLQGVRRELSELNDKHDAVLERVDNLVSVAEKLFRGNSVAGAQNVPSEIG